MSWFTPAIRACSFTLLVVAGWFCPRIAWAEPKGGLRASLGAYGNVEGDDVSVTVGGVPQDVGLDVGGNDDLLESNLGVEGYFLFDLGASAFLGPRAQYLHAKTDASGFDFDTFDLGGVFRYDFLQGDWKPFVEAGAGYTHLTMRGDWEFNQSVYLSGNGWHSIFGGGVSYACCSNFGMVGAVHYLRQVTSVHGDDTTFGFAWELEAQFFLTRLLISVGVEYW